MSTTKVPERITFGRAVWERVRPMLLYLRRNPVLIAGLSLLLILFLFVVLGYIFYDVSRVEALSVPANELPSKQFPLGTDRQGRDILAVIIVGTPLTLRIGLIAGTVGVFFGMILGFVSPQEVHVPSSPRSLIGRIITVVSAQSKHLYSYNIIGPF